MLTRTSPACSGRAQAYTGVAGAFATRASFLRQAPAHSWIARASSGPVAPVRDDAVPEGHKGLHESLYGSGASAEAHQSNAYDFRPGEDDGTTLIAVHDYLASRDGEKPLGVYAVFDADRKIQYVGYSRNIVLAVKTHVARLGNDMVAFVRPMVFANKAMATRANLEAEVEAQIQACGTAPPGNGPDRSKWEGEAQPAAPTAVMSEAERAEYEEKKLKLRKAMGEAVHDAPKEGETEDMKTRRENLIAALSKDDWSEVIDRQTAATVPAAAAAAAPQSAGTGGATAAAQGAASGRPAASPFTQAHVHRAIGSTATVDTADVGPPDMTIASVTEALDEVRPYLLADGGDVDVVDVANGNVLLRLQGACSSCPSSSATMSMGIERALRARFGSALKDVIQVDVKDTVTATVETVDNHLMMLRGAVTNFGGRVDVVSVEGHTCTLRYKGPKPIGMGLQAAIKDRFPMIKEVVMLPIE